MLRNTGNKILFSATSNIQEYGEEALALAKSLKSLFFSVQSLLGPYVLRLPNTIIGKITLFHFPTYSQIWMLNGAKRIVTQMLSSSDFSSKIAMVTIFPMMNLIINLHAKSELKECTIKLHWHHLFADIVLKEAHCAFQNAHNANDHTVTYIFHSLQTYSQLCKISKVINLMSIWRTTQKRGLTQIGMTLPRTQRMSLNSEDSHYSSWYLS